jgi:hypothetical protein
MMVPTGKWLHWVAQYHNMKNTPIQAIEKRIDKIERTLDKIMNNHLYHIQGYQMYILALTGLIVTMLIGIFIRVW